jgi:hypothetical protein
MSRSGIFFPLEIIDDLFYPEILCRHDYLTALFGFFAE